MSTTLLIRIDPAQADRFRRAAGSRGLTLAEYMSALMDLRDNLRLWAREYRDEGVREEALGLLAMLSLDERTV